MDGYDGRRGACHDVGKRRRDCGKRAGAGIGHGEAPVGFLQSGSCAEPRELAGWAGMKIPYLWDFGGIDLSDAWSGEGCLRRAKREARSTRKIGPRARASQLSPARREPMHVDTRESLRGLDREITERAVSFRRDGPPMLRTVSLRDRRVSRAARR